MEFTNEIKQLAALTEDFVYSLHRRFNPNRLVPVEDLAWDCFTTLYLRRFFEKYDVTKSKKSTYLYNGVKNYLIDQERIAQGRVSTVSSDEPCGDNMTFADILDKKIADSMITVEFLIEAISVLSTIVEILKAL